MIVELDARQAHAAHASRCPRATRADTFLAELAKKGLERRFEELPLPGRPATRYRARLELELGVIQKMGFSGYFLIVWDFINWAKQHGIPVGPGRGSGAGCIVAYSLRITDLDPHPLQPALRALPEPRARVDARLRRRLLPGPPRRGHQLRRRASTAKNNVGQIITFGQLKAKSVLRDVCRVYGLPFSEGDRIAKLVPEILGITLKQAIFGDPEKEHRRRAAGSRR